MSGWAVYILNIVSQEAEQELGVSVRIEEVIVPLDNLDAGVSKVRPLSKKGGLK